MLTIQFRCRIVAHLFIQEWMYCTGIFEMLANSWYVQYSIRSSGNFDVARGRSDGTCDVKKLNVFGKIFLSGGWKTMFTDENPSCSYAVGRGLRRKFFDNSSNIPVDSKVPVAILGQKG